MTQYEFETKPYPTPLQQLNKEVISTDWITSTGEDFYKEILYYQELFGNDITLHGHFLTVDRYGSLVYKYPVGEYHDQASLNCLLNNMKGKVAKYRFKSNNIQAEMNRQNVKPQPYKDPTTIPLPSTEVKQPIQTPAQPTPSYRNNPQNESVYNEQIASQQEVRATRQAVAGGGLNFASNNPGSRQQPRQPQQRQTQQRQQAPAQRNIENKPAKKQRKSAADKVWMDTIVECGVATKKKNPRGGVLIQDFEI